MPKIAVYEVASFYSMLETEPVGRNIVAFCTNISCMLRGAEDMVAHAENKLKTGLAPIGRADLTVDRPSEDC